MVNGIRASDPLGLNKGRVLKFNVGSRVQQGIPKEGRSTYRPKRFKYNNEDEDNSLKTLIGKNYSPLIIKGVK